MCDCNFPSPGTSPDLTFYFNTNWNDEVVLAQVDNNIVKNCNLPITLNPTDNPETQSIGYAMIPGFVGDFTVNESFIIYFSQAAGGGTLTFSDNKLSSNPDPPSIIVRQLTGGSGNYLFATGFVVILIDRVSGGRQFLVYFTNK